MAPRHAGMRDERHHFGVGVPVGVAHVGVAHVGVALLGNRRARGTHPPPSCSSTTWSSTASMATSMPAAALVPTAQAAPLTRAGSAGPSGRTRMARNLRRAPWKPPPLPLSPGAFRFEIKKGRADCHSGRPPTPTQQPGSAFDSPRPRRALLRAPSAWRQDGAPRPGLRMSPRLSPFTANAVAAPGRPPVVYPTSR
jgi:hypothetical protein